MGHHRALRRKVRVNIARASSHLNLYSHGSLLYLDIRHRLKGETISTLFDVGANVGQSVEKFAIDYPDASIFTFEPDPATFSELQSSVAKIRNAKPFNLA